MRGKKFLFVFGLFMLGMILSASFASAYYFPSLRSASDSAVNIVVDVFQPILNALFGGYGGWNSVYLFERLMLFIILVSMVYLILGKTPMFEDQKTIRWLISLIVPLMGVRFIDFQWLNAIFLQYEMLTIILTTILPFILYFFFLHGLGKDYPHLRKIGWIFFIGIYAGLWASAESSNASTVYFWTTIAAILAWIFDKRIEMYLNAREMAKHEKYHTISAIAAINDQLSKIENQISAGTYPDPKAGRKIMNDLKIQRKYLSQHMSS